MKKKRKTNNDLFIKPLFLGLKYKVEFVKLLLINTVMNKQISHLKGQCLYFDQGVQR